MMTRRFSSSSIVTLLLAATPLLPAAEERPSATDTGPVIVAPIAHDTSPPLASLPRTPRTRTRYLHPEHETPAGLNRLPADWHGTVGVRHSPHVLQTAQPERPTALLTTVNAEGLGNGQPGYWITGAPPDTTGDVGGDYYVQWVNSDFAFFAKGDGAIVPQPGDDWFAGNILWSGFSGPCQNTNDGDPVVLYDQLAERWMMSQFALPGYPNGPFYQCIAVSVTSDPTGSWYRYAYTWPNNYLNDYPKFGVWPDGYYMTANQFTSGAGNWAGAGVAVFDRVSMLAGGAATMQYWNLGGAYGSLLPADLDGTTPPPVGSAAYLAAASDSIPDALQLWKVQVDWATPANSTCGDPGHNPNSSLPVTPYLSIGAVQQPGTTNRLDTLWDRLMFRMSYRNFGSHESLVLNHTVKVGIRAGVRWYEVRDPGGTPVLHQEGTFSPDTDARWMGGIAMDHEGNIALGYSVSSSTVYPSIRSTGRLASDPLGEMTQAEATIVAGGGSQIGGLGRWGDYSTMSVDPSDDCSFWYTTEYISANGSYNWRTRIASFKFPSCVSIADQIFSDGFESADWSAWTTAAP